MKVNHSGKHSTLLQYGNNYGRKKFDSTAFSQGLSAASARVKKVI